MTDDSFYQAGAGTQHPDFGTQLEPTSSLGPESDWHTALRPVTIRQLREADRAYTGADFKINKKEPVSNLSIVAQVLREDVSEEDQGEIIHRVTYELEDGTGRVKAFYKSNSPHPLPNFPLRYGWFSGTLFRTNTTNYLRVNSVRPVKDPHEIFFHFLEVVTVSLIHERGHPPSYTQGIANTSAATIVDRPMDEPLTQILVPLSQPGTQAQICTPRDNSSATSSPPGGSLVLVPSQPDQPDEDEDETSNADAEPPESDTDGESFRTAESDNKGDATDIPSPPYTALAVSPSERDPLSHLTSLQRDILLHLYHMSDEEDNNLKRGLPILQVVQTFQMKRGGVSKQDLGEAIEDLFEKEYIDEPEENNMRLVDLARRRVHFQ